MDVFDAIYTRRSIRKFKDMPVEFDKIIEVIKAGSFAPCAGDLQNWKFMLEYNPDVIKGLYHHTLEQEAFITAQIAIIVVADTAEAEKFYGLRGKRLYSVQNCAAAMQNMLLAAHALGLGAVWIGAFDENRINDMYKIPSVARAQGIILLGYPDETPPPRHVKYVWFLVNYKKYGLKYDNLQRILMDMSVEWELQRDNLKRSVNRNANKLKEKFGIEEGKGITFGEKGKELLEKAKKGTLFEGMKNGKDTKKKPKKPNKFIESLKKPKKGSGKKR
ncbi:nitroreductase family protein [Candidatus Woesearchaeota archaeon]|nr:nitroreductase family protein [Candidatus Woesearchaeota archaeon]